jgi:hypothetical protein
MDMSSLSWVVLFAATFYLSLRAYHPFPSQLKTAWIGLAVPISMPVLAPAFRYLGIDVQWLGAISALAIGNTVVALSRYFAAYAKVAP